MRFTVVLLAAEGLHPSSKGARVKFSGTRRTVIDGPFSETNELIAGFWLIQVKKDTASLPPALPPWSVVAGTGPVNIPVVAPPGTDTGTVRYTIAMPATSSRAVPPRSHRAARRSSTTRWR